jgi:hypothetical protein
VWSSFPCPPRKAEPREATRSGQALPVKPAPTMNSTAEIASLSLSQVQARLGQMNGMPATAETDELEQNLVARWAKLDPIGAAEFAADAVAQGGNPRLLQTAAKAWAKTDPAGASQWAATLDSPLARDTALGQIFNTWSTTDPAATGAWILQQGLPQLRSEALRQLAGNWVSRDPGAAID